MEGKSFRILTERDEFCPYLDPLAVQHRSFVSRLQRAHDQAAETRGRVGPFMFEYEKRMAGVAKGEQLHYTPPEVA